jgi:hypothetical protein
MTIKKGETMADKMKIQPDDLREKIANYKKSIAEAEEELALRKDALVIQKKYPKVINPNFEFETTEEGTAQRIREWEFSFKQTKSKIDFYVGELRNKIVVLEEELSRLKNE